MTGPNLVPATPSLQPNYWCTWYAQNYWVGRGTELDSLDGLTNRAAREEMTYSALFDESDGWAVRYLPRGRKDFIFLIDHGWQTKIAEERVGGGPEFFNLVADSKDFPQLAALLPKQRLATLNQEVQALGWNSLGIWTRGDVTSLQALTFVRWSQQAGVRYWKVDGGDIGEFNAFRAKEAIWPELVIEYVTGAGGNLNPGWDRDLPAYPSVYDEGGTHQGRALQVLRCSDTFRTYDAAPLLMSTTTLRRAHDILKQTAGRPEYRALLNVQDDCNLAIGLGVLVASKRHPDMGERLYRGRDLHHQLSGPRCMQRRTNEVERFGRWARIAPAIPAGVGSYRHSQHELVDRCEFSEFDTWAQQTYGKMVSQSAPAIVARNMPLPAVEADDLQPYVCATTYLNGATGIATEGRVLPDDRWVEPRARVIVDIRDASRPIGIAGRYETLTLRFAGDLSGVNHIWAQDLLADSSHDILAEVVVSTSTIRIHGTLIDRIGTEVGDHGDLSVPAMVIQLAGNGLPVAGDEFDAGPGDPARTSNPPSSSPEPVATLELREHPEGILAVSTAPGQTALRRVGDPVLSGTVTYRWEMSPAEPGAVCGGYLVLSSDPFATASVSAGVNHNTREIALWESGTRDEETARTTCPPGIPYACELTIDVDGRTATLEINGATISIDLTESFTSIAYLGYRLDSGSTLFAGPQLLSFDGGS
jgi:hypothetical protein